VRYAAILGETKVSEGLSGPFAKDGNAGDDAEYLSRSASFIGDICIPPHASKREQLAPTRLEWPCSAKMLCDPERRRRRRRREEEERV
jgi:hypothetical protein